MPHCTTTLYDQLGGKTAITAVVEEFYKRVLADPELNGFFVQTDMEHQREQQIKFLAMALGGPNEYQGKSMEAAHHTLGITEHHFGLVAGHLVGALEWAGVKQPEIDAVVAIVGPLKDQIVTV